jgi:pantetheine-phosphate adenylyltransferase
MNRVAIFPGTFDPFTKGHADIVSRSLNLFDELVIAVGFNPTKNSRYFDIDFMIERIQSVYSNDARVQVIKYNELTASLAEKYNAKWLVRGLRNTTDFEYENSISQLNRYLNDKLETVFLISSPELAPISSSIIREVHKYNGDVSEFLPYKLT